MIDKITKKDLKEFLELCTEALGTDCEKFYDITLQDIKHYRNTKEQRVQSREMQMLEHKWYNSLENGKPDYSIYDDLEMIPNIWACWQLYARDYLKKILSNKSLSARDSHSNFYNLKSIVEDIGIPNKIIDLGCGIGYTTAALVQIFPDSKVYGTNIETSFQWKVCKKIAEIYNFSMVEDVDKVGQADLIFASEYFEHFDHPVEHLEHILLITQPKELLIANAFTAKSPGHFNIYYYFNKPYPGSGISKLFNNMLRSYGYEMVKTNCWNNRPVYWKLKQ